MRRLPSEIEDLLRASGQPWRVDTGSKHFKVIVGGRLAAILPKSLTRHRVKDRSHRNAVAQIRRAIRGEIR